MQLYLKLSLKAVFPLWAALDLSVSACLLLSYDHWVYLRILQLDSTKFEILLSS